MRAHAAALLVALALGIGCDGAAAPAGGAAQPQALAQQLQTLEEGANAVYTLPPPLSAPRRASHLLLHGAEGTGKEQSQALRALEALRGVLPGALRDSQSRELHGGGRVVTAVPRAAPGSALRLQQGTTRLSERLLAVGQGGQQLGRNARPLAGGEAAPQHKGNSPQTSAFFFGTSSGKRRRRHLLGAGERNVSSWEQLSAALNSPGVVLIRVVSDILSISTAQSVSRAVTIAGACGPLGTRPCVLASDNAGEGGGGDEGCLAAPTIFHRAFEVIEATAGVVRFERLDFRCFHMPRVSSTLGYHGGVAMLASDVDFVDCAFRNSLATFGGAIFARSNRLRASQLTITNCTFIANAADRGGAVVQVTSGAQHGVPPSLMVRSSTFRNNSVSGFDLFGGALYVFNISRASVWDSTFEDNEAMRHSGAIYPGLASWAASGGGIYANFTPMVEVGSSSFARNKVVHFGRDIFANPNCTLINRGGNTFDGLPVPTPGSIDGKQWTEPPPSPPPSPPPLPPPPPGPPSSCRWACVTRYAAYAAAGVAVVVSPFLARRSWALARRRRDSAAEELLTAPLLASDVAACDSLSDASDWSGLDITGRPLFEELPLDDSPFEGAAAAFSFTTSAGARPAASSLRHSGALSHLSTMIPYSRAWEVGRGGEGVVRAVIVKGSWALPAVTEGEQAPSSSEEASNGTECVLAAFKEHDQRTRLAADLEALQELLCVANKCRNAAVVLSFVIESSSGNGSSDSGSGKDSGNGSGNGGTNFVPERSALPSLPLPRGFVSQLYPLCDLSRAMRSGELVLTPRRICDLLLSVAQYLSDLHDARFAHRDLKPANVLLTCDCDRDPVISRTRLRTAMELLKGGGGSQQSLGSALRRDCSCLSDPSRRLGVAVCDVGMARAFHAFSEGSAFTSGHGAGTLTYLAPERFNAELAMSLLREGGVSHRSARLDWNRLQGAKDLWCLGAIGWELLNYHTTGSARTVFEHLSESPLAGAGDPVSRGVAALMRGVEPAVPRGPGLARASAAVAAVLRADPAMRLSAREVEYILTSESGVGE